MADMAEAWFVAYVTDDRASSMLEARFPSLGIPEKAQGKKKWMVSIFRSHTCGFIRLVVCSLSRVGRIDKCIGM